MTLLRKTPAEATPSQQQKGWGQHAVAAFLSAVLLGGALWQFSWASRLGIDSFDGINYLLASRAIAGGSGDTNTPYVDERPPLVPLLLAFPELLRGSLVSHWRLMHCWFLAVSWLTLVPCYLLFRLSFRPTGSLGLVVLIAFSPLFTNYASFVSADLPSAGCTTACLVAYVGARRTGKWGLYVLSGLLLSGAMLCKYPLLVLPAFLLLMDAALWWRGDHPTDMPGTVGTSKESAAARLTYTVRALVRPRLVVLCLVGVGVFHTTQVAVTMRVFSDFSFAYANVHPYLMIASMCRRTVGQAKHFEVGQAALGTDFPLEEMHPTHEYLAGALAVFSLPVCILALLGMGVTIKTFPQARDDASAIAVGWLLFFPAVMTLLVSCKEMRYVFPAVPAFAHAVGSGWRWLYHWARSTPEPPRSRLRLLAVVAFSVIAIGGALHASIQQILRLGDPVYTSGSLVVTADETAIAHDPQMPVLWGAACLRGVSRRPRFEAAFLPGALHTVTPREPLPLKYDDFWGFYHVGAHTFEYLWNRPVGILATVVLPREGTQAMALSVSRDREGVYIEGPEDLLSALTEDAILTEAFPRGGILLVPHGSYCFAPIHRLMEPAPYPPPPMGIVSVERATLDLYEHTAQSATYASNSGPVRRLDLTRGDETQWRIAGGSLPDGWRLLARQTPTDFAVALTTLAPTTPPPTSLELIRHNIHLLDFFKPVLQARAE